MTREEDLLRRYSARRSQAAFAELVRRYLDFVYSLCRRELGDPELAQDVTQAVFLILAEKAGSLRRGTVLSAWLFQVAHHACRNARRVEARRRRHEGEAITDMERTLSEPDVPTDALEARLDDALARLSAPDREALLLRYAEEMSLDEVATALGVSAAAAHKRVSRALERLRRQFGPAGAALTGAALGVFLSERMVRTAPPGQAAAILSALTHVPAAGAAGSGVLAGSWGAHALPPASRLTLGALVVLAAAGLGWAARHAARSLPARPSFSAAAPTQTLRGRVLDTTGRPAPGVTVTLLRYEEATGLGAEFARVRTDAAGRYAVAGAPAGADGWAVVADSGAGLGFGAPGGDCRLTPPARLRLRLVGADGRPLPGVPVQPLILSLLRPDGQVAQFNLSAGCPDRLKVTSDAAGVAAFTGLPRGAVASFETLDTQYVRRPPAADGLLLDGPDAGVITVPLTPGAAVAGRVTYAPTGRPAVGVRVGAQRVGSASAWGEAVTDAGGRYRIAQLGPGRYNVALDEQSPPLGGAWTAAAVAGVALGPGQKDAQADLRLVRGGLITGTVTRRAGGGPVGGVEVGAYGPAHPATGAWVGGGWTDGRGHYRIRVPPGRQHVYLMSGATPGRGTDVITAPGRGTDVITAPGRDAVVDFALPAAP